MNKINIKDNPFLYFAILELKEKHFFCLSAIIYSSILIFSNSLILLGIPVYVLYDYYSDNSGIFNPFIILIFFCSGCIPAFTIHFSPKSNNSRSLPVALTARNLMSPFGT